MRARYTFFHPMHHWGLKSELVHQNRCSLSGLRRRYTGIELDRYQPRFHLAKLLEKRDDTGERREKNVRNQVSLYPIATVAVQAIAMVVEAVDEEKQINEPDILSDDKVKKIKIVEIK